MSEHTDTERLDWLLAAPGRLVVRSYAGGWEVITLANGGDFAAAPVLGKGATPREAIDRAMEAERSAM